MPRSDTRVNPARTNGIEIIAATPIRTLGDVVEHYNPFFKSGLAAQEKNDLVEYLKSL
jgi:hypothetical protein